MTGIYRLTSPSGKAYIGQSWNIKRRMKYYSSAACKEQIGLYRSLVKYGFKQHKLDILHELPEDVTQSVLDEYEILYMELHRAAGIELLNMKEGGIGGRSSKATIEKIKIARAKQIPPTLGKKFSEQSRMNMSKAIKGLKRTAEQRAAMVIRQNGVKRKPESIEKLKKTLAEWNYWDGAKHSDSAKQKMRLSKLGVKRKPMTDETKRRIGEAAKQRFLNKQNAAS